MNRIMKGGTAYQLVYNGLYFSEPAIYGKKSVTVLLRKLAPITYASYDVDEIYNILEEKGVYTFD